MAARFRTNVRRLAGVALALLALTPAVASAQETWQHVGGTAPGGDDLAVIGGVPHVAWASPTGVHVSKLASTAGRWEAVGRAVRHTRGSLTSSPALTSDSSGALWVAWVEDDSRGTFQARVARFAGGRWREVVGGARPINLNIDPGSGPSSASVPRIIFFRGTPYVAYIQDTPVEFTLRIVRLNTSGTRWEDAHAPFLASRPGAPRLAVSGGRLFLAVDDVLSVPHVETAVMNGAGSWKKLGVPDNAHHLGDIADVGGRVVIGYSWPADTPDPVSPELRAAFLDPDDTWDQAGNAVAVFDSGQFSPAGLAGIGNVPYTAALVGEEGSRKVLVSRYVRPNWEGLSSPSDPGQDALFARLASGNNGIWILYGQSNGGTPTYHLARFGGAPSGEPEPPTGTCDRTINGTAIPDELFGTRASESIFGRGGGDVIKGFGASDCLFGNGGNDVISGGSGNDFFHGGGGNDRIYGGSGNDDINGGGGNDRIVGGSGSDAVNAGRGNDTIYVARRGSDVVECGPGRDTVVVTVEDGHRNCERVIVRR